MSLLDAFQDKIPSGAHCSICKEELYVKEAFVQTYDIPIVCKKCWPFYIQATILCQLVFQNDMGTARRDNT